MEKVVKRTVEAPSVRILSGTRQAVQLNLSKTRAEHVIALAFERESPGTLRAISETLTGLTPMITQLVAKHKRAALDTIVEALVPIEPPAPHLLAEARMHANARQVVLESGDWLTGAQIAELAGFSAVNLSAQPNRWKKDGFIFAIRHHGTDYFPGYALDPEENYRPRKSLAPVIEVFRGHKNGWGLAFWFASVNSYLGGRRPQDVLVKHPERVLEAAQEEIAEVGHA